MTAADREAVTRRQRAQTIALWAVVADRAGDGPCPDIAPARPDRAGTGRPRARRPVGAHGEGVPQDDRPLDHRPARGRVRRAGARPAAVRAPARPPVCGPGEWGT